MIVLDAGALCPGSPYNARSEEHTSELQSHLNRVCRLLLEKKTGATRYCPADSHPRRRPRPPAGSNPPLSSPDRVQPCPSTPRAHPPPSSRPPRLHAPHPL